MSGGDETAMVERPLEVLKWRVAAAIEVHRNITAAPSDVYATLNDLLLALAVTPPSEAVQAAVRVLLGVPETQAS